MTRAGWLMSFLWVSLKGAETFHCQALPERNSASPSLRTLASHAEIEGGAPLVAPLDEGAQLAHVTRGGLCPTAHVPPHFS